MNVNVKNPTKPYSAPPYIQVKTDRRVSSRLLGVLQKPQTFLWSTEKMVRLELQREGTSHFFTLGSEITTKFKTGLSEGGRGDTMEENVRIKVGC